MVYRLKRTAMLILVCIITASVFSSAVFAQGGDQTAFSSSVSPVPLVAEPTPEGDPFVLTYDANGGSGTWRETRAADSVFALPDGTDFKKRGKLPDYWKDAEGNSYAFYSDYTMPWADTSLYMQWKDDPDAVNGVAPVVANPIVKINSTLNKEFSYTFPIDTFYDENGDVLSYSVDVLPAGITFDADTRTFSGTPTQRCQIEVSLTADDNYDGTATDVFTFQVGVAPVAGIQIPDQKGTFGVYYIYHIPEDAFYDPDGDEYTLYSNFTMGVALNPDKRTIEGNSLESKYDFQIIAYDNNGYSDANSFSIYFYAPPIVANEIPNQFGIAGVPFSYAFPENTFYDHGGEPFTYTSSLLPAGLSFDADTRTFSGMPAAGTYDITVTADNGYGGIVSDTFTVAFQGIAFDNDYQKIEVFTTDNVEVYCPYTVVPADDSVTWQSLNEDIVTITGGIITANSVGKATITVTTSNGLSSDIMEVEVVNPSDINDVYKANITGKLIDSSGTALSGYAITLYSQPMVDMTDAEGKFGFADVSYTSHTLVVSNILEEVGRCTLNFTEGSETLHTVSSDNTVDIVYTNTTSNVHITLQMNALGNDIAVSGLGFSSLADPVPNPRTGEGLSAIHNYILMLIATVTIAVVYLSLRKKFII